ncbi:hypothetical protein MY8738_004612 [Beauveria namnaoensis]
MALLWYTVTTLSALAAVHRLFQFHAVHSLFVSCASRTDTRHQTRFENLERFFIPSRALPASKWPRLVTFEFEQDGNGILIHVPEGSYWGTPTLLCSYVVVASLCCQSLAKPTVEPLSMLDVEFYKPTEEDMAKVHSKFISSLKEMGAGSVSPPVLPKVVSLANASSHHLSQARDLVDEAIKQQGEYNLWRLANPRRGDERNPAAAQSRRDTAKPPSPPQLTHELLGALKLTNNVDTQDLYNNGTLQRYQDDAKIRVQDLRPEVGSVAGSAPMRRADGWDGSDWMADQDHSLSQQPFHSEKGYKVSMRYDAYIRILY